MSIPQPTFRCFQCSAFENLDDSDTLGNSYIQHNEPYSIFDKKLDDDIANEYECYDYSLFGYNINDAIWSSEEEIQAFWNLTRKGTMQLDHAAIHGDSNVSLDFFTIRKWICEFFLSCRSIFTSNNGLSLFNSLNLSISSLTYYMKRLKDIPDSVIFNKNNKASLNYLHLCLDISWLTLTTEHYLEDELLQRVKFEYNLKLILCDMINVSIRKFEKNSQNLELNSPFLCCCFKEIWLLIQLYVEYLNEKNFCKDFWYYFNKSIKSEINYRFSVNGKENLLAIWITYHISNIQGYDKNGTYIGQNSKRIISNYTLIEENLKILINNKHTDETMNEFLQLLSNLQLNFWTKDVTLNLFIILWKYFSKKINYSFSREPESTYSFKQYDYNVLTQNIIHLDITQGNNYELFLNLLSQYLKKMPTHWPILKRRIYSKLSPFTIVSLTDVGIHNVIQLFFVLSVSVSFKELTDKLTKILNEIPQYITENNSIIWSAHMALLIMKIDKCFPLNDIPEIFLNSVLKNSLDRNQNHLMQIWINGVKKIMDMDKDLIYKEENLFGSWLKKYLQTCPYDDASKLLNMLKYLVEIISKKEYAHDWWIIIETNIVEAVTFLIKNPDAPLEVADLSATLISCQKFNHLLNHLTGDHVPTNQSVKFLSNVLKYDIQFTSDEQKLLIKSWIRISILHTDKNEIKEITNLLRLLPIFETTNLRFNSDDPLYELIRHAEEEIRDARNIQDNSDIKKWMEVYFGKMDKWIRPVLTSGEKGENSELLCKVYMTAALLFFHCAPALYNKDEERGILYRLTTTMLLPSNILLNKRPSNLILTALKQTWHLFVRGIARLDFKQDCYLDTVLKDLVIKYLPHMHDSESPLIRCIDNEFEEHASIFIIEKLSNILTCKSKKTHEDSLAALNVILEMSKKCDTKYKIFVEHILNSLCEQLMFSKHRIAKIIITDIINEIKTNKYYFEIKDTLKKCVLGIIHKHLSFHAVLVFKLLDFLTEVICQEINEFFPKIIEAVHKLEYMRGVGYDKYLRRELQKLKEKIEYYLSCT